MQQKLCLQPDPRPLRLPVLAVRPESKSVQLPGRASPAAHCTDHSSSAIASCT